LGCSRNAAPHFLFPGRFRDRLLYNSKHLSIHLM
jgi:hypothetical protein